VPERKAWYGPDNISGWAVLAHVPEARPKYNMSYLYSCCVGLFGPSCLDAHSIRHVMNNLLTKKIGKYFIFIGIFEPTEYDDHNI
jgi:hypothetical protein